MGCSCSSRAEPPRSLLTPAKSRACRQSSGNLKICSAGTVTWATRPLAVGSPPLPLAAQRRASLPAVLSAGWPCRARNRCAGKRCSKCASRRSARDSKCSSHTRRCGVPQRRAAVRARAGEHARASGIRALRLPECDPCLVRRHLTPPSSGRPRASFAVSRSPLMSNVRSLGVLSCSGLSCGSRTESDSSAANTS